MTAHFRRPVGGARLGLALVLAVPALAAGQTAPDGAAWLVSDSARLCGIGIVIASATDPDRITNPHIRAHASEGRLFRTVVEQAAAHCDLGSRTLLERELLAGAAEALGKSAADLRRAVTVLGRSLGGPWRADEKAAALAAWLLLGS
ncbi:MAG: hypothetical protein ACREMG_03305 [Gemmatimonadales bacterium]